eukprot:UN09791
MHIISGTLKGRQFNPKFKSTTRPCTDQAKQSLFNFLISSSQSSRERFNFFNCKYGCDLFAGTGNIGYEMISRGVQNVIFVDHYKNCVEFINEQCKMFDICGNTTIIKSDVFRFIKKYDDNKLDLCFAGPPYGMNAIKYQHIPDLIFERGILQIGYGLFILEHDKTMSFDQHPNFVLQRVFRSTHFSFFSNNHNLFEIS